MTRTIASPGFGFGAGAIGSFEGGATEGASPGGVAVPAGGDCVVGGFVGASSSFDESEQPSADESAMASMHDEPIFLM
jgi:hypothetical protein